MPKLFSEYTEQFFWDFKRMDNVNYNFEIVTLLYRFKKKNSNNPRFNKLLLILLVSIVECVLYDFLVRIHDHRQDLIPNLSTTVIYYLQGIKETDELQKLIDRIRAQNLLRASGKDSIYDDLEELRRARNRIHIQNKHQDLEKDEYNVFTEARLNLAENVLERVCETLCNVYPRGHKPPLPMSDFPRPWL